MTSQACTYNGTADSCRGSACDFCRVEGRLSHADWLAGVRKIAALYSIPQETDPKTILAKAEEFVNRPSAATQLPTEDDDEMPGLE
jgi:hypothetical protein